VQLHVRHDAIARSRTCNEVGTLSQVIRKATSGDEGSLLCFFICTKNIFKADGLAVMKRKLTFAGAKYRI
jgi:hypothetical protein